MSLPISIYSQIGIILLIALSAKNAILIVEFAVDYRKAGMSVRDAALEAGRVRLRPILMTSLAFVLGVMPLMFASGAGSEARIALGTAVVFGMFTNTIFGTLFVPNFFLITDKKDYKDSDTESQSHKEKFETFIEDKVKLLQGIASFPAVISMSQKKQSELLKNRADELGFLHLFVMDTKGQGFYID